MVVGRTLFSREDSFEKINSVRWRLVIVDE